MDQIVLVTGEAPEVVLPSIGGDLRLSGWEQNQFQAESDEDRSLTAEQKNGNITLHCHADCTVRVPRRARLRIQHVGGDARVKSVEGPVEIQNVGGDLVLRRTVEVAVGNVSGDLSAKKIDGSLRIGAVGGDVSARSVAGEFQADTVGADLYLRDLDAGARARVGADVILNLDFAPNHTYEFKAGGDILCRVPPDASVKLELHAGGEISVDAMGAQVTGNAHSKWVTLGTGEAQVKLDAGGDLSITSLTADPEAMGDFGEHFGEEFGVMAEELASQIETQIESQIEAQMADFEKQLSERMANLNFGMGGAHVNAEEIAARAQHAAERVAAQARRQAKAAQRKAERQADAVRRRAEAAQRRAERMAERHQRHAEHKPKFGRGFPFNFEVPRPPKPPMPPTPPSEPVSNDERMTILRMLEQGKITVDQAEKLLAALEGNE
jgi:hypothetical protein